MTGHAPPSQDAATPGPERREVLRLAAASLALAAAGCDAGTDEFGHPLYARPQDVAEEAASYATVLDLQGLGRGVLVRTRAGHAVKVEGNPAHPASLGATDVFAEAAVLSLHDPERSRRPRESGRPRDPAALVAALEAQRNLLQARGGEGLHVLTGPIASPTTARLLAALAEAMPAATWHQHDPLADDAALAGAQLAFGRPVAVLPDLRRATAVLSLGADLLGPGPAQLRQAREWAAARAAGRAAGALPVLMVAEASPSLTGAKADRRLPLPPGETEPFARAVAAALGVPGMAGSAHPAAAEVAAALRRAGPLALVVAGRSEPPVLHVLAHAMNAALGSTVVRHVAPPLARPEPMGGAALRPLAEAMAAGAVTHLIMLGVNPAYDAPAGIDFGGLLRRVPFSLHAGMWLDETAHLSRWHLPLAHPLESWGDLRAFDGTAAIRQPATVPLAPLAGTADEVLAALAGRPAPAQSLVRDTWQAAWGEAGFDERWAAVLEAGVIADSASPELPVQLQAGWDPGPSPPATAGLAAIFAPDPHVWDGGFAEIAWLQEMPRPLTKLAWGNAALLAPATAAALGLAAGDEVALEIAGRRVVAPVWPVPGHAPGCVTLPLGHGRIAGLAKARGFDAYALRPAATPWVAPGLTLRPTGRRAEMIATQLDRNIDSTDAARSVAPGEGFPPPAPAPSLYPEWRYEGHAWGMTVDLDACIGCNACAVACQSENNVPVVGPEEMSRGREMHWLRIDLYQQGDEATPDTLFQPVPCMHCEKAPCEVVCPVNATVHDHEGLNVMVYPRCIGTRTCSNNCPYKIRRFNWFDYARGENGVMVRNPDVPLRPRGVIEKCTYCSHRIDGARAMARSEGRPIRDGDIETACQRACPTQAIIFGDVNDPDSAVSVAKREGRNYALLGELDTRPRTTYLARVRPEDTA